MTIKTNLPKVIKNGNLHSKSGANMANGTTYFSDLPSFQEALSETDVYGSVKNDSK